MARRESLNIVRAAARLRTDAWDDLWPSVTDLVELPTKSAEVTSARRRIGAMRKTSQIEQARVGLIPKPNGLMRPAHLLSTDARLYYQALVDSFVHTLDAAIGRRDNVFGYRALEGRSSKRPFGYGLTQWKRFRRELRRQVASGRYGAMVRTDLAAFFELIPHGALEERLTSLGVKADVARELRTLLRGLMGRAHGLPQGPDPSGVLASAYLYPLDQALISAGYGYVRFVDDIVVLAADQPSAKRGLRLLEQEARRLNLIVQSAKTELTVGVAAMEDAVGGDDEIAGIDYVVRRAPKSRAIAAAHKAWMSASRRKAPPMRLVKYLINRLSDRRDGVAVEWCLKRLGTLDYLAPTLCRYLSAFANRPSVQSRLGDHLCSSANISEWEEMNVYRAALSARSLNRRVLDRARVVAADRNAGIEVRQFALVVLGIHGEASDHDYVERHSLEGSLIAAAALIALQSADARTRGRVYASVKSRYPELRTMAKGLEGRKRPLWPTFRGA